MARICHFVSELNFIFDTRHTPLASRSHFFCPGLASLRNILLQGSSPSSFVARSSHQFLYHTPIKYPDVVCLNKQTQGAVTIALHTMYCLRHFLPMYSNPPQTLSVKCPNTSSLFLSSSASPYFVLLLAISFAFAHRPWYHQSIFSHFSDPVT